MEDNNNANATETLNKIFYDPTSKLFLSRNTQKLYEAAKAASVNSDVTIEDVQRFKQQVESIARAKQSRLLGGRSNRAYSFRKYKLFGHSIISGDLGKCFFFYASFLILNVIKKVLIHTVVVIPYSFHPATIEY